MAVIYVQGVSVSVIKKIAKYVFGEKNVISVTPLPHEQSATVVVQDAVKDSEMERFKQHWMVDVVKIKR